MIRQEKLDQLQYNAVHCKYRNTLVVAAPGSGKTTVIVNRVAFLIKELKVRPSNIVVLTFTKAAAENMKVRYINLAGSNSIPYFGTLHSLFYKILRKYHPDIEIINENDTFSIIKKVLLRYMDEISEEKIKEAINNISLYKTSGNLIEGFNPSIDRSVFLNCLKEYEEFKQLKGLMDFDDLQIRCRELFLRNPAILKEYQEKFKYILVDEFQDCDELQVKILRMLNSKNSIFAVGDEDQSIYGFRGSKPGYMIEFNSVFKGGKKLFLNINYRCPENIVEMSKRLINHNLSRNKKEIKAFKSQNSVIKFMFCKDESIQAERIAEKVIRDFANKTYNYCENAILFRTNRECTYLINEFIRRGVPFKLMEGEYNFFNHFICKDLSAYLALIQDNTDRESFMRIINKPYRFISKLSLEKIKRYPFKENIFDMFLGISGSSLQQYKNIKRLKRKFEKMKNYNLKKIIQCILKDLGYLEYINEFCLKNKINNETLLSIIDEFIDHASKFNHPDSFLKYINKAEKSIKSRTNSMDAVILSTIHGVKGMEYKNIFIINCNSENIPYSKNNTMNVEEERRLFYVGITRAIENLCICIPETFNGNVKAPSIFIDECRHIINCNREEVFIDI